MRLHTTLSIVSITAALAAAACAVPADETAKAAAPIGAGSGDGAGGSADVDLEASVDLTLCGSVDLYAAASASADGKLVVGGKPLLIKAGAHVEAEAMLAISAHVCVHAKIDVDGKATHLKVTAEASAGASAGGSSGGGGDGACGGGSSGGGCMGGGSSSGGSSSGGVSGDIDLSAEVDLCGTVKAFTAAGAEAGSCTIAGTTLPIAAGTSLAGEALLKVGANVCIHAKLDASGAITAPSSTSLNLLGAAKVRACGKVKAYVAASADASGSLAIGGCGLDLAAGASVSGEAMLKAGASVCIDASLNASGELAVCTVTAD